MAEITDKLKKEAEELFDAGEYRYGKEERQTAVHFIACGLAVSEAKLEQMTEAWGIARTDCVRIAQAIGFTDISPVALPTMAEVLERATKLLALEKENKLLRHGQLPACTHKASEVDLKAATMTCLDCGKVFEKVGECADCGWIGRMDLAHPHSNWVDQSQEAEADNDDEDRGT